MLPKLFIGADPKKLESKILETILPVYSKNAKTLDELFHPEIFVVYKPNTETITIEEIRDFLRFFRHRPVFNPIKTGIIFLGDNLTEEAQNVLLKYLEEHPSYVNLIIGVLSKQAVLPTIYSRMEPIFVEDSNTKLELDTTLQELLQLYKSGNFLKLRTALQDNPEMLANFIALIKQEILHKSHVHPHEKERVLNFFMNVSSWQTVKLPQKQIIDLVTAYLSGIIKQ